MVILAALAVTVTVTVASAAPWNVYGERARARAAISGQTADASAISALQTATNGLNGMVVALQGATNGLNAAVGNLQAATNGLNAKLAIGANASTDFLKADGSTGSLHFVSGVVTNTP